MPYELSPWKVDLCREATEECDRPFLIGFGSLPEPPSPDRLIGFNHAHLAGRLSADQRIGREDQTWRSLVMGIGRHFGEGRRLGVLRYAGSERAIIVPQHKDRNDREAWLRDV